MGLKIQINGQKVGVTAPARPPVVFIDGQKKRLTRGVTFIDGKKVVLWGNVGLLMEKIDYPTFDPYGTPQVFYVSRNVAYVGDRGAGSGANYVQKLNISNPSAAKQESYIQWGGNISYSADESTSTQSVYYGAVGTSGLRGNKIVVENDIASVQAASSTYSINSGVNAVYINGWLMSNAVPVITPVGTTTETYVFFNGTQKYKGVVTDNVLTRYNNASALIPYGAKIERWTASQRTTFSTRPANPTNLLVDGENVLVCDALGVSLVNAAGGDVWRYTFADRDAKAFVIGKIRDYYVLYENQTIVALNASDGQVYITESAPKVFNYAYTTPHISATGYLGVGDGYNGFYRISLV